MAEPADAWAVNSSTPAPLTDTSEQSNQSADTKVAIKLFAVNDSPMIADKPSDTDPVIAAFIDNGGATTAVNDFDRQRR